ncbi:hypothetical protein TNCV_1894551 [Trichonephila clavipes]|nr:hypothetical protein TNCV_1894551 [Trichonephila clavipes]
MPCVIIVPDISLWDGRLLNSGCHCHPKMSLSCLIGCISGDLAGQRNTLTPYRTCLITIEYEGSLVNLLENTPLIDAYKTQCNDLNLQTDILVYIQGMN